MFATEPAAHYPWKPWEPKTVTKRCPETAKMYKEESVKMSAARLRPKLSPDLAADGDDGETFSWFLCVPAAVTAKKSK